MKKGLWLTVSALLLTAAVIALPIMNSVILNSGGSGTQEVNKSDKNIVERSQPDTPQKKDNDEKSKDESVSFLVTLTDKSLLERYVSAKDSFAGIRDYLLSDSGKAACDMVKKSQAVAKASIKKLVPNSDLDSSMTFSAVLNGITVKAPLSSMEKLKGINGVATVSVLYDDMYFMENDTEESTVSDPQESSGGETSEDPSDPTENEPDEDTDKETAARQANLHRFLEIYDSIIGYDSESAYKGEGMLIAVIDSEFDTADSVFSKAPEKAALDMTGLDRLFGVTKFNASPDKGASGVYVSPKIIFAYDYAGNDRDTGNDLLCHGTAVAAVAAGCTADDDTLRYRGVAPEAQLALMTASGGRRSDGKISVRTDALIAALDDAAKIGADVINLSLGSLDGIRNASTFNTILNRLSAAGIAVSGAAGNGGYNGYELGRSPDASDIFYSAENTLFEDDSALTAGAVTVPITFRRYITIGDRKIYYTNLNEKKLSSIITYTEVIDLPPEESGETTEVSDEQSDTSSDAPDEQSESSGTEPSESEIEESPEISDDTSESSSDEPEPEPEPRLVQDNKYIYVYEYSSAAGFGDKTMTDKTLIINVRQTDDLQDALEKAENRGVTAVLLVNGGASELPKAAGAIPVAELDGDVSTFLLTRPENDTFDISLSGEASESSEPTAVSAFTSYCASDSMGIGARVVAPGENILAVPSRGEDAFISGTSAAAPCIAGSVAIVKQYLKELFPAGTSGRKLAAMATSLLLGSSRPLAAGGSDKSLYCSPRQQGFGLVDIANALKAGAYLTTDGDSLSAVSLGDGETGQYEMGFTVTNIGQEKRTYKPSYVLQTDSVTTDKSGKSLNTLRPQSLVSSSGIKWICQDTEITSLSLEPGESAYITALLSIDEKISDRLRDSFPEGFWLDGYIFMTDDLSARLSLPFSGFYGSSESASPFDSTIYDTEKSVTGLSSSYVAVAYKGDAYSFSELEYSGDRLLFSRDSIRCREDDSTYSGAVILPDLYTLRDVYELTVKISDKSGKQICSEELGVYSSCRHKDVRPFEQLADRTRGLREAFSKLTAGRYNYTITARTKNPDGTLGIPMAVSVDFELDAKDPVILSSDTHTEDGRIILELQASDENGISSFVLYATAYDRKNNRYNYIDSLSSIAEAGYISESAFQLIEETDNDDGTYVFRYDITDLQRELRKLSVSTTTWQNKVSDQKIAYKALDASGNASVVKIADVIEYGTAEFVFTDQNGMPAKGISVVIGNIVKKADKDGVIRFEGLEPDYYNARVIADSSEYELSVDSYIVSIYKDKLLYRATQTVSFTGEYPEESPDPETAESSVSSVSADEDKDEPIYALIFVAALLVISSALFIIRKNFTKK